MTVLILAVLMILLFAQSAHGSGEPIAVAVTGGRMFAGVVDAKTNDAKLCLRSEQSGITLRRPIEWNSIELAQVGEQQLTSAELHGRIETLKAADKNDDAAANPGESAAAPSSQKAGIEELPSPKPRQWNPETRLSKFIAANRANNVQVCSLSIEANVGHFDRYVEASGIVLHVYPLDDSGRVVPVDGTLNVDLVAGLSYVPRQGTSLPQIGHWAVRLTADQFGPSGAVVKLPFQSVQPEFNLGDGPYGLVHARLSVPGNGSFEASQSMVRIRPYSAVRDQQQINGQRFFDVESVNRWGD
jgi:hypothetical protein